MRMISGRRERRRWMVGVLAVLLSACACVVGSAGPAAGAAPGPVPAAVTGGSGLYVPLTPARVLPAQSVNAGATFPFAPLGRGGVPATGVSAVAFQLTARSTGTGFVTVLPAGAATGTSNVNYQPNVSTTDSVVVGLGTGNQISFVNGGTQAAVAISVDVVGYYLAAGAPDSAGSTYVPLTPARITNPVSVAANGETVVSPLGTGGVPAANVSAVVVHVTARGTTAGGVLTAYPDGVTRPATADINYQTDTSYIDLVPVKLGTGGRFRIFVTSAATVTVDVVGYYQTAAGTGAGGRFTPVAPVRVQTVMVGSTPLAFSPRGQAGVPAAGVSAVVFTLTATSTALGGMTVYPNGITRPGTNSLFYHNGGAWPVLQIGKLGTNGQVAIANTGTVSATVRIDVVGYFLGATAPPAPTQVGASPGDRQAVVTWTPPQTNGGSAISGYTVASIPDGNTATAPAGATTATVTGLTNGVDYRFAVRAVNAVGTSAPSAASPPVTPAAAQPPGRPFVTEVYPRDGALRVNWSPPDTGPLSVSGYTLSATVVDATTPTASLQVGPAVTEAVIGGLTNGTRYTVTVTARNAVGAGQPSPPSTPVVPVPADVPLKPAALLVTPLNARIDVQWVEPQDGGAPVTSYQVTAQPGNHVVNVAADTTVAAITGLSNGTPYDVRVVAINSAGRSAEAGADDVRPEVSRVPGPPTDLRALATANGTVSLAWSAPGDSGTGPVTSYTVTAVENGRTVTSTGTTATMSGLDPATQYTFTVRASNAAGLGQPSAATRPVFPKLALKVTPVVLTSAELATLRLIRTDGSVVFEQPPDRIAGLAAGTILAIGRHPLAPSGMLSQVTGVSTQGGLVTVATRQADLSQVFDEGSLAAVSEVSDDDLAQISAEGTGLTRKQPTLHGRTLDEGAPKEGPGVNLGLRGGHVVIEISKSFNADYLNKREPIAGTPPMGGRLEGQLDLDPQVDSDVDMSLSNGVTTFDRIAVQAEGEFRVKFGFLREEVFPLPKLHLKTRCFDFQAGPVPVVICLDFTVQPKITVDGSVGVSAAVQFARVIGAELSTHNGLVDAFQGINREVEDLSASIELYGDMSVRLDVPLDVTVFFYDAAGTGIAVRPFFEAFADTTQDPWWEIRAGIALDLFLRSRSFFGHEFNFEKDNLVTFTFTLVKADGPFSGLAISPREATINAGDTAHFTASPVRWPAGIPIHWRLIAGAGTLDDSGNYHSDLAGDAVVEAFSPADGARPELKQRAQVHVTGFTVPSPPLDVHARPRALAVDVSWLPPETDGNAPIRQYVIVSDPPTATVHAKDTDTQVRVPHLTAGTRYQFQVFAVNDKGQSQPSAWSEFAIPHEAVHLDGPAANVAVDADGVADTSGQAGLNGTLVSGNGRYVFFEVKGSSNLAPAEIRTMPTLVFLVRKDLLTGEIVLASRGPDGHTPMRSRFMRGGSTNLTVFPNYATNYDGTVIAYVARINDQVSPSVMDVLVHDIAHQRTAQVTNGFDTAVEVSLSDDGRVVSFLGDNDHASGALTRRVFASVAGEPAQVAAQCLDCSTLGIGWTTMTRDGRTLYYAFDGRLATADDTLLYRKDIASGTATALTAQAPDHGLEIVAGFVVSGDGSTLAAEYFFASNAVPARPEVSGTVLMNPTTGATLSAINFLFTQPRTFAIGLDDGGDILIYGRENADFSIDQLLYDITDGSSIPLTPPPGMIINSPTLAGDGNLLAYGLATADRGIIQPGVYIQHLT